MMLSRLHKVSLIICICITLMLASGCSTSPAEGEAGAATDNPDAPPPDAATDTVPPEGNNAASETPPVTEGTASADAAASSAEAPPPDAHAVTAATPATEEAPVIPTLGTINTADPVAAEASPAPVAPEPIAVHRAEPSGDGQNYTVQSGDTLMKIAFEVYGDLYQWRSIYSKNRNKIKNPSALPKGLVLSLDRPSNAVTPEMNGERYRIKQGDTLGTISNQVYGTPSHWKALWQNNRQLIKDPNKIFAGFYLYYVADAKTLTDGAVKKSRGPASKKKR